MTKEEEIIEIARKKADYWMNHYDRKSLSDMSLLYKDIEAFAKLVAAQTLMKIDPRSFMSWQEGFEAGQLAERERIKEQNAPEIEKTNAYIKQLELEKMESDILHNEHLKLLGEIKAMTEAARLAEREKCAKFFAENDTNLFWGSQVASHIRARGQE